MFYLKSILFSIIVAIVFYVLLDVMETRNSVISANNPYSQKEIDFTKYGSKGKEDAVKQVAYYENLHEDRKKINDKIEAQKADEVADAKLKNKMILKGNLPANSSYSLRVYYQAQNDISICKTRSFWNGLQQKGESFDYVATITNNQHKIVFPTNEMRWSNWFGVCDYQIDNIHMDGEMIFERKNNKLKFVGNTYPQSEFPKFVSLQKVWKNQYTINIRENSHLLALKQQKERKQQPIVDGRDIDNVLSKQLRKELKLLAKAFNVYNQIRREKVTKEEGKRLLRNEEDLTKYMNREELNIYLSELKETIIYKNGDPIDPWGKPYKYRVDYAIIYSEGVGGFKYKNNLSHKLKPFITRKREAIKQLSTLSKLFEKYIDNMGYAPNTDEAQKLLRHESNLASADFYNQRGIDRYNKIPKTNGNPIDPWGNPYQYKVENIEKAIDAALFSFGNDGIKSNDDIYFYDIYFSVRSPSQIKRNYPKGNSKR